MEPPSLIARKEEQSYTIPPSQVSDSRMPAFLKRSLSFMTLDPALKSLPFPPQTMLYMSQFSSVTQSCPTPCDPMDCSTPGLPVHHQLLEFTQTHVH